MKQKFINSNPQAPVGRRRGRRGRPRLNPAEEGKANY